MRSCVILCIGAWVGAPLCPGQAAEGKPKGKAPLVMKVVKVAADHLVLEHSSGRFFDRAVATYTPRFRHLRVYDRKGKELTPAQWKKRIKKGARVYVAADEKKVDPAHLRKAEKGALVLWGVLVYLEGE
jgi:hypothetical protein